MKVLGPSLFVSVHGHLQLHPWIVPAELGEDAYSLFRSRSELMGWSRSASHPDTCGLWDMNDASWELDGGDGSANRVAWFQVGVGETAPARPMFPIHPLLTCAGDTLDRVGTLDMSAVQFLVPLQVAGAPGTLSVPNWFHLHDPASRVAVRVTLDGGEDPVLLHVVGEVSELVSTLAREPFAVAAHSAATPHVQLQPEVTDGFWMGEGRHPVTFDAVAPDWSPASIAWTATLFVEACRRAGVGTSVLVNIERRW